MISVIETTVAGILLKDENKEKHTYIGVVTDLNRKVQYSSADGPSICRTSYISKPALTVTFV